MIEMRSNTLRLTLRVSILMQDHSGDSIDGTEPKESGSNSKAELREL